MPEIEIRSAIASDIHALTDLEHNYSSDHVWQMDFRQDVGEITIVFREIRLPRSVQVQYPQNPDLLLDEWTDRDGLLVAVADGTPVGYIAMEQKRHLEATWITDLAVARRMRRQKVGSSLVIAAQDWALQHGSQRLIIEMQPKNYPAIQFARKLGFELCGYNDHYYANHDIALFFSQWLR
jgi:GNAT superfamily N-acetyltransferase